MARITRDPIDPRPAVSRVEHPGAGAILTFLGVVRIHNRGRVVTGIEYHAYEEMAIRQLDRIEEEIRNRWPEIKVDIIHRVGFLKVGESSVLITLATPHRVEGFAALQFAIDSLKDSVPIWKKEMYTDGYSWLEGS